MPYAFIQDVPATKELYAQIRARLPRHAPGLLAHVAIKHDGGLRYVDVWDSEETWEQFRMTHVEPAVGAVLDSYGIPHDHSLVKVEVIEVVDVWTGAPS